MVCVVNGRPGSGKTTFEKFVQSIIGFEKCRLISTIDFIKQLARTCGWNGDKTPENRKFLSDLKDLLTKWNNVPYNKVCDAISEAEESYGAWHSDPKEHMLFFVDSREPEEIKKFCDELGAISVLIRRPSVENEATSNHADEEVFNYNYDCVIVNNGTIADLKEQAYKFLDMIGFEPYKAAPWRAPLQLTIDDIKEDQ